MSELVRYKLLTIIFLDSIYFGLTYPFLSTHLLSLGANHISVGILASGYFLCKIISTDLIPLMKCYKRVFTLTNVLFAALTSHVFLMLASNYIYIIFARYIFSIAADQCRLICTNLLLNVDNNKREENNIQLICSVLDCSGYIIGPITAGYLFESGFSYICSLAIILTLINICIVLNMSEECNNFAVDTVNTDEKTVSAEILKCINDTVTITAESEFTKNWDVIVLKFLHNSCTTIFFAKFTQLLANNFMSSSIAVGYTYAYITSLSLSNTYFALSVKNQYAEIPLVRLLENSVIFLAVCLIAACYSPFYTVFMIMCIPITFLSAFINSVLTDLFASRRNVSLDRLKNPLRNTADLISPIAFGIMCNNIGHHAVTVFSVIPTILSLCIIKRYTKLFGSVEPESQKDK